jgi:hypothetical protein
MVYRWPAALRAKRTALAAHVMAKHTRRTFRRLKGLNQL